MQTAWRGVARAAVLALGLGLAGCGERQAPDPSAAVARAYAGVPAASHMALRLAHLKGYVLVAAEQPEPASAAALASQGMLEVYDAQPGAFEGVGLDEAALRAAAAHGTAADVQAALADLTAAQAKAGGDARSVVRAMTQLASGLYQSAANGGGVDGLEYQHSLGAALAARELAGADRKLAKAKADLDKLIALWPSPAPPAVLTPPDKVDAQASKVVADLA